MHRRQLETTSVVLALLTAAFACSDEAPSRIPRAGGPTTVTTRALSLDAAGEVMGWMLRDSSDPPWRVLGGLAYDAARQQTLLFGGENNGTVFGDTWAWNGSAWTRRGSTGPTARSSPALAYDSARQRVVLFGGKVIAGGFFSGVGDTWEWDGNAWSQVALTGPYSRWHTALAYDSARQRLVLFGGMSGETFNHVGSVYSDTWEWDGATWRQLTANTGPAPRYAHALAYDSARRRTVLFGGYVQGAGAAADTWEWDGVSWQLRSSVGPSARIGHALAYDSTRQRTVLFGGSDSDTWEWDGTTWLRTATDGPSSRSWHAVAYDSQRQRTVMFGPDAWEYHRRGGPCTMAADCAPEMHCVDDVCCDQSSCGTCEACNLASKPGACTAVTNAVDTDTCSGMFACSETARCVCTSNDSCTSGFCNDGVCCDTACDGPCDTCAVVFGAAVDGICLQRPRGSPGSPSCAPYVCPGNSGICLTSCTGDADCASEAYCRASDSTCQPDFENGSACTAASQCTGGACANGVCKSALGRACMVDGDCASAHCVDGVCCDDACGGNVSTDCRGCSAKVGATADGVCTALTNAEPCDDGNACNQGEWCYAGTCSGGSSVQCYAIDDCHSAGTCDPATGCPNPAKRDGTACPDGGTCQAGECRTPAIDDAGLADGAAGADAGADAASDGGPDEDGGLADAADVVEGADVEGNGGGAASKDAATAATSEGGCNCGFAGRPSSGRTSAATFGVLALLLARRSRRRSGPGAPSASLSAQHRKQHTDEHDRAADDQTHRDGFV